MKVDRKQPVETHRKPEHGHNLEIPLHHVFHDEAGGRGHVPQTPDGHQGENPHQGGRQHRELVVMGVQVQQLPRPSPPVDARERETHRIRSRHQIVQNPVPVRVEGVLEHLLEQAEGQVASQTDGRGYEGAIEFVVVRRGVDVH